MGASRGGGAEDSSPGPRSSRLNLRRSIRVGAWNVLSLQDDCRVPALSAELGRLGIAVAALSEVRRPGNGEISVGGYTYYWSGRADGRHTEGVAVAVSDRLISQVKEVTPVSERIMRLRLAHSLGVMSIVAVYAPTGVSELSAKEAFYAELNSVLDAAPGRDTKIVLGDFNAVTGTSRDGYEACVGPHGSGTFPNGERDTSSSMLLDFAASRGLRIGGSWFQRPNSWRWSWYSNTGRTKKEIDHILVDGRWRMLRNCRVFRSAQFFSTDHRLLVATLGLRLRVPRPPASGQVRLDVGRLRDPQVAQEFTRGLGERLEKLGNSGDTQVMWTDFRDSVLDAAGDSIPKVAGGRRSDLSQETVDIIEECRKARLNGSSGRYRELRRECIRAVSRDREARLRDLCETVDRHVNTGDARLAFRAIRELRAPTSRSRCAGVLAADGSILSEEDVPKRWAEYFEKLHGADPPSRELPTDDAAPMVPDPPISIDEPDLAEIRKALGQLKDGKAPGVCGVYVEMLKVGGEATLRWLHTLICSAWNTGVIPTDWKRGLIVPIWKGKGDVRECSNYRGVTLLSVPGKVFARVLLNRIRQQLLDHQRPEQSGFTPKRSTVDRILALRVLTERLREFDEAVLAAYIDFKKAFDSVSRESLWRLLELRGIPPRLIHLISALYSSTESAVKCGAATSDFFLVQTGVRQGCVLAPSLFSTCMDWIMDRVVYGSRCGVSFGEVRITDLDFADDAVIFAETLDVLTGALETLSEEAEPLGLRVSWVKTKIQEFGSILDAAMKSCRVEGQKVEIVEKFTYLGSVVHGSTSCEAEVARRLGLAYGAMNSLKKAVWRSRYLSRKTKVRIFSSLVMPVLLYSCEAWTLTGGLKRRLNTFVCNSLRRIFGIRWQDHVSNQRVLELAGMSCVTCQIRLRQLRSFGHVMRFPPTDPANKILCAGDPKGWKRPVGRPRKRWLEQLEENLVSVSVTGLAAARSYARRSAGVWKAKVDAAKRLPGACPHT